MNPRELDRYKRLLLAKLDELSARRDGAKAPVPTAGVEHGDPVDQANSDAEAELQLSVHHSDAHLLRAIEEALARMRQGTFGVCQVCGQPISKARAVTYVQVTCSHSKRNDCRLPFVVSLMKFAQTAIEKRRCLHDRPKFGLFLRPQ